MMTHTTSLATWMWGGLSRMRSVLLICAAAGAAWHPGAFAQKPFAVEAPAAMTVNSFPGQPRPNVAPRAPEPTRVAASHTNATPITITDCPNPCPASGQAASLYPSSITVAGEVGVVQRVSVTINGFSHAFPADVDFLLVSPSGRKSVIMSDFGAGSPGVSNINLTIDDYADRPIPSTVTGNTGVPFVTGTYRPANSGTTDLFPAPAPAAPYTYTMSAFNGDNPNGVWSLYVIDDANLDGGSISGGWTITFDVRPPAPAAGDILITEFRTRGAGTTPPGSDGSADEYIEIYNNTDNSITIIDAIPGADPTSPTGAGWRFAGAQGATETTFLVLPQTLSTAGPLALPPRGYFLISTQPTTPSPAGNTYSLATYPTGTGITASGSANVSVNPASATVGFLPDDVGIAVFSTANAITANRLDSVGYSSVTAADYKEGTGLAPATGITTAGQHAWVRRSNLTTGMPVDTGNNLADFMLVDTTAATLNGIAASLGAPGPQRGPTMTAYTTTAAPSHGGTNNFVSARIDPMQPATSAPNYVRDLTPVANGTFGTMKFRRMYTNNTGLPIVAMRYRVIAMSTLTGGAVSPAGSLDLRVLNSPTQSITLTDTTTVTGQALTVQTPAAQASGGGINTSLAEGVITTTAPLANGASTVVEFNLGVMTDDTTPLPYSVTIIAEGLTVPASQGVSATDTFARASVSDIAITKTDGVTTATPGGSVTYTITASNAGPDAATGVAITDTFPATCTSVSYTASGAGGAAGFTAAGSGNINDMAVSMPVGSSVTYSATCMISAAATGTLANTATATVAGDPTPGNNSATDTDTLSPQADLSITKTDSSATVVAGSTTTYTIVASNAGPSNAPTASVSDTFPATCTSVNWTCSGAGGGACTAMGSGNIIDAVNLPAGGSVTYLATCTVSASATGMLSNTATVSSSVTDPVPANNAATDVNTILAPAALVVAPATVPFGTVAIGVTSPTQTVTLSNTGDVSLQVTAITAVAAPFAQAAGGTCSALPITIAGGGSCTINYTFTPTISGAASQVLTYTASAPVSNTATLMGTGAAGVVGVLSANLNFGTVVVGNASIGVMTITNTGGGPLSVTNISAVVAPFSQVAGGSCAATPFTLVAGASCTVNYQFLPGVPGVYAQSVTVTADVGAVTVNLAGAAQAVVAVPVGGWASFVALMLLILGSFVALRRRV